LVLFLKVAVVVSTFIQRLMYLFLVGVEWQVWYCVFYLREAFQSQINREKVLYSKNS